MINVVIIKQTYDDNTSLDEFIINISNDINPAPPSNNPKNKDNDDNPRPKAYGLYPKPKLGTAESNKSAGTHVPVSRHFIKRSGVQPQEAQEKHKRTEQNTKSTGSQYFKGSGPFDFFAP